MDQSGVSLEQKMQLALESAARFRGHPVNRDTLSFWTELISEARQKLAATEGTNDPELTRLVAELETVMLEWRADGGNRSS